MECQSYTLSIQITTIDIRLRFTKAMSNSGLPEIYAVIKKCLKFRNSYYSFMLNTSVDELNVCALLLALNSFTFAFKILPLWK